jgi:hypothetical protein
VKHTEAPRRQYRRPIGCMLVAKEYVQYSSSLKSHTPARRAQASPPKCRFKFGRSPGSRICDHRRQMACRLTLSATFHFYDGIDENTKTISDSTVAASAGSIARKHSLQAGQPAHRTGVCVLGALVHPFSWAETSEGDGSGGSGSVFAPSG